MRAVGRAVWRAELHSGCWVGCLAALAGRVAELKNGRVAEWQTGLSPSHSDGLGLVKYKLRSFVFVFFLFDFLSSF